MSTCHDCGRRGRIHYVAAEQEFPGTDRTIKFGAVRRILCDHCLTNYEQPQAALAAEAAAGIPRRVHAGMLRTFLKKRFRAVGP